MHKMGVLTGCLLLAAAGVCRAGEPEKRITGETRWLCYYGDDRRVLDVPGYDLLILESEGIGDLTPEDKAGRLCVAYMSVGEAERWRWYWPDIKDKPWVLDVNPHWPDARLVDVRSPEWRDLLLDSVAPLIIEAGYDGFILDNVDTAEALLHADAQVYAGADEAMVDLIRKLREKYPDAVIIANGGLSIVPEAAECVDAMMYEGTVSSWRRLDDGGYGYGEIEPKKKTWLRPRLLRVRNAGLPILALEYADLDNPGAVERVREAVRKAGNNPYVSRRDLDVFPGSEALPKLEEDEE